MSSNISSSFPQHQRHDRLRQWALIIGLIGTAIAAFGLYRGLITDDSRPIFSWLIGFAVWFATGIGMLFIVMIWNILDSGWSVVLRRQVEHGISIFPWLGLFFLPLLLIGWFYSNPGILWEWMNPDLIPAGSHGPIGENPIYLKKAGYLNLPFFTIRIVLYFSIFSFLSWGLRKYSFRMDVDGNPRNVIIARIFSGVGLPIAALTTAFASFDMFMSISFEWFSTMYGVWFFAASMRAGLAMTIFILAFLGTRGHMKGILDRPHLYRLGCLFLGFTVFWAYVSFCQYFIIYHANIPEETFWFNLREVDAVTGAKSSWWWVSLFGLILGNFLIPFVYLLFYKVKIVLSRMLFISLWIFTFFIVDLYFNILPVKNPAENVLGYVVQQFSITHWDLAAIIGLGGICLWAFLRSIPKAQPIPIHDPRIQESLHAHE